MMKRWMAAALAALMMSMNAFALAEAAPFAIDTAKITVQGTAKVNADPDLVTVTANASVTADSISSKTSSTNPFRFTALISVLLIG